jgi:asparagine synthase (glutamine-hydrolysing)
MSAIAGIIHMNNQPVSFGQGRRMMSALQKYPTDDVQTWEHHGAFLGCHAQWVTPESVHECLPFYYKGAGLAITADAILDNRDELFDALNISGDVRQQMGDGQLILLAYEKWREDMPKYLLGDFAFIIWDERRQIIFGARDFTGSRTLYYFRNQNTFSFCTVIGPLFTLPGVERKLNDTWLAEYLAIEYMFDSVDTNSSLYRGIRQIPPAHSLLIHDGKEELNRFCDFHDVKPLILKSDAEYEEAFRDVFSKAVNTRLRTFRNIGSYLSGGLDSGTVVSFAAKALSRKNQNMDTFSCVPEPDFNDWTPDRMLPDESTQFRTIFQKYPNVKGHILNFKGENPLTELDSGLDIMEMPYKFFENSFWVNGIYREAARQHVGVLLSGEQGNYTISWGPAYDFYADLMRRFHWISLYREISAYSRHVKIGRTRLIEQLPRNAWPRMGSLLSREKGHSVPQLISDHLARRTGVFEKMDEYGYNADTLASYDACAYRLHRINHTYWWNTIGTHHAKQSLYYGIKDRNPATDLRVIRFCLSVPIEQYVCDGMDRALIRRSTEGILPDRIRMNQYKYGVQGADFIHRIAPEWDQLQDELCRFRQDALTGELFHLKTLDRGMEKVRSGPQPQLVDDWDFKLLMRAYTVQKFLSKNFSHQLT